MPGFRPLADRVLVKRADEEEMIGSIVVPTSAQEKPQRATVIAVGPGRLMDDGSTVAVAVQKGDNILFGKYAGSEFKLEGVDHLILREDEILGVVEP